MAFLSLNHVSKIYRNGPEKLHVLKDITTDIEEGTINIVSGESGSGKSTLLNLIGGLDTISGGSLTVDGRVISSFSEEELTRYRAKFIGFVFQFHYLLDEFTALENVMLPLFMQGEKKSAALVAAEKLLSEVHLDDRLHHYPAQLSGGERQRVAVARSLITDPALILADEPTGNLDEKNSRLVEDLLFSLVEGHRKTLILVTHDSHLTARGTHRFHLEHGVLKEVR